MSAGCFSWFRLHIPWGAKKQRTETKPPGKLEACPPAIAPASTSVENENQVIKPKFDDKLSENPRTAVPTTKDYVMATVKEVLTLSQSAAAVSPVPFLQEAIGVALKIIQVCEDASAVEQNVKELQVRVGNLMIIVVDHAMPNDDEDGKEAVVKIAKGIEKHIQELLSTLETINEDLTKIGAQNRWVIAIYKEPNMKTLEDCMSRLSVAMQNFMVANDLHDSALINGLHARLAKMANKVDDMQGDMKHAAKDIRKILLHLERSGTMLVSDTLFRQEMPLKPEIFHGRDDLVESIAQLLLHEETSHVCILGPGGMGKTSVSLAVVESPVIKARFPGGNVIWVPCIEAISATLLLEILYVQLQIPGDKQVTLEKIISELDTAKQPRLILLDNFETPWNAAGGPQKVGNILRKLGKLSHIAIIVTMRGRHPPYDTIKWQLKDIKSTDEAACLRIYHDVNPGSENDPDVPRLLDTLGYMPFAVKLIAKLGAEGQSTAKDLLEAWLKSGPDIFNSDEPEQSMNHSISLSVESRLVKRNPNAITLLAILSLLPAGTTKENLHWWAPGFDTSMIPSAIATLSQAGLLVENKREYSTSPVLFVIPVVQSFMQQNDRIAEKIQTQIHSSCCEYVLAHACRFDDPTFLRNSKVLAPEDTNIQSILFSPPPSQHTAPSDRTMEALIAFGWHRCDTKPSLEVANHLVAAARATGVVRYIALATWCLGKSYALIGDHYTSYDHLYEAYWLFNTLPLSEVESQRLGGQCGIDFMHTARFTIPDYDQVVSLACDVEMKCAALSDDVIHGHCLVTLAAVYQDQRPQEALRCLDHARTMLKAENNHDLADVYQVTSWVHYAGGRLPEALNAIKEAWEHSKLTENPSIQAGISLDFGRFLFSANKDQEAWKYTEMSLTKASYTGNRLVTARALEYMGYGCLRRGDYQNAYAAYEAAAKNFLAINYAHEIWPWNNNMVRIKQKQENPNTVVGFDRPSIDIDQTLFYPPVQASGNDVPII